MTFSREHRRRNLGNLQTKGCVRGVRSRNCVIAVVRCWILEDRTRNADPGVGYEMGDVVAEIGVGRGWRV